MDVINKLEYLITLLTDKKGLLSEMMELTKNQKENISEADIDALNKLIDQKDSIIQKIDKIDSAFNSTYEELKKELNVTSLEDAEKMPRSLLGKLKDSTRDILDIISKMAAIDDENRKKAKELKENLAMEIKKINTGMQANNAYRGQSSFQGSYFIDSKK